MKELMPQAERIAAILKARKETVAVAESSAGGLISAALLAVPGASAYFAGGGVIYTRNALLRLMNVQEARVRGQPGASESFAALKAQIVREHLSATWGLAENGAAGPTGNSYGHAAGHSCMAVSGPIERAITLETGSADRLENMYAFTAAALRLFAEVLEAR